MNEDTNRSNHGKTDSLAMGKRTGAAATAGTTFRDGCNFSDYGKELYGGFGGFGCRGCHPKLRLEILSGFGGSSSSSSSSCYTIRDEIVQGYQRGRVLATAGRSTEECISIMIDSEITVIIE